VYVVVFAGVTVVDPLAATVPIPGEMVTLMALVVVHVSVTVWPASIVERLAVNESITGLFIGVGRGVGKEIPGR
jgi:hypothetical protein